jgi:hypothetical protein
MRKTALAALVAALVFLSSCAVTIDPRESDIDAALPNGYIPDDDDMTRLKSLSPSIDGILSNASSKSLDGTTVLDDEVIIDSMKEILFREFREDAPLFFGESEQSIPDMGSARTIVAALGTNGLSIWHDAVVKKSWGPWWVKYTFSDTLKYRDTMNSKDSMVYCTQKAYAYNDPVTSSRATIVLPALPPNSSDIKEIIRYDVALATSGKIEVNGNTKYGFFPKLSGGSAVTEFWSPHLAGGYSRVAWSW